MNATFHDVFIYDDGRQFLVHCGTLSLTREERRAYLRFLLGV